MKKQNNSLGFTLIELLAAIIIVIIVLIIAVTMIQGLLSASKTNAFKVDANMILKTVESKITGLEEYDPSIITVEDMESELGISNYNYKSLTLSVVGDYTVHTFTTFGEFTVE
ncbi:MAG: prepilin-type N-terminal cleavage/methylation domain-containing protein [Bacilli bacterium]|nr:prepilin-type N-terminal cleavage/methylation domain-containing protein [Bacilli bacterium]MDD3304906.1 prepilin-type N-terminal cleavage/methylation domain-containing protein [Bacilli bacterium]MDD4053494.1 prepilin-type N-terminal cleavage/methylation domain-containing protein [Bacilli bacterium]MDD4411529.1 prepilin-type N-terminal cleavage/methylation domain-containing protein [Bacilli bacterium]